MERFKRFLPEDPIVENENFVIYGNAELEEFMEEFLEYITEIKKDVLTFLGLDEAEKIPINLFNDHDAYLEFTRQFYEPSPYSQGNFTDGMISHMYDLGSIRRLKRDVAHELVHLLYEKIREGRYERILWLDEGVAQYLSKEKSGLEFYPEKFKSWYLNLIVGRDKKIPKIEYLKEHGNTYGKFVDGESNSYDGYQLSYLMVRYMIESGMDVRSILRDIVAIKELEEHILEDTIEHFNRAMHIEDIKRDFYEVKTPLELMDYMDMYTIYGWIDMQGQRHDGNLKNFRENYRIGSLEELIETGRGTCIEQCNMIKTFFDRIGVENKFYCYRRYEVDKSLDKDVRMHCFVLFFRDGKVYHFEHANSSDRGIHEYSSLEEALREITYRPDATDIRELTEIPEVPVGLTYQQFNEYVNGFEAIPSSKYKKTLA